MADFLPKFFSELTRRKVWLFGGDHSGFVTGQVIPFAGGWA